ncbi:heavy-metal-associated domain-containing protein [Sphaerimonospora cavernae]|uniref:Heavy-metal-associated domain-containing protein n=1 Tax=Sphaerimonospora cavernae TaxID=1740611 RepID=A0ABV6U6G1_9ACTN
MSQLVLSVPGITCGHCVNAISEAVGEIPGVSAVEVDLSAKTVTVAGAADPSAVRAAIDDAGYETV